MFTHTHTHLGQGEVSEPAEFQTWRSVCVSNTHIITMLII